MSFSCLLVEEIRKACEIWVNAYRLTIVPKLWHINEHSLRRKEFHINGYALETYIHSFSERWQTIFSCTEAHYNIDDEIYALEKCIFEKNPI